MEEKPISEASVFVFIFVNPLSGGNKGKDLTELKIQNFRLKTIPQVQVQIYNITEEKSKNEGLKYLKYLYHSNETKKQNLSALQTNDNLFKLHVWSAGGDGTVMSLLNELIIHDINLNDILFSCIPFGTGNDFSQAFGWGRTVDDKDLLGDKLENLAKYIEERLDNTEDSKVPLDIWDIDIKTYQNGYIQKSVKRGLDSPKIDQLNKKMCIYCAIGVQGSVGNDFESKRSKSRFVNILTYITESLKWALFGKFPPITGLLSSIESNGEKVLECKSPYKKSNEPGCSLLVKHPIEVVIQNMPRIWGRDIDLWNNADETKDQIPVKNRDGSIDPKNWTDQLSTDNKLEIFGIESTKSYLKLQLPETKENVIRIGQFEGKTTLNFTNDIQKGKPDFTFIMIDGEFYKLKRPQSITFKRLTQITTVGKDAQSSKIVKDEVFSKNNH